MSALTPFTYSKFPAVRVDAPAPMTDDTYLSLMRHYRRLYAAWNTPNTHKFVTQQQIDALFERRILRAQQQRREQRARVKALKAREKRLTDTPRVPPFRGECIRRAVRWCKGRWTAWQVRRDENYRFKTTAV